MDSNSIIKVAFDDVLTKRNSLSSKSEDVINQIGREIQQALSRIQSGSSSSSPNTDHKTILSELKTKLEGIAPLNQLKGPEKELNAAVAKYTKLLEKSFNPDISKAYRNIDFDTHTLNGIIAGHLYRSGEFHVGDSFVKECNQPEAAEQKGPFAELFLMLESMRSARSLEPAIKWAASNRVRLEQTGSNIELKLHRHQFFEILQRNSGDALKYVRETIAPLFPTCIREVQKLMACLLWAEKLDASPYAELLSSGLRWEGLAVDLTRQYCKLMGQPYESPLSVAVEAGVQGLPTLLKLMNVVIAKNEEWQTMKELPLPIDLDREFQFHSVFVCPVLREQASEENPPMLLPCGHALCKQSIIRLSKNNTTRPFKCPYCPAQIEAGQCRQIYL